MRLRLRSETVQEYRERQYTIPRQPFIYNAEQQVFIAQGPPAPDSDFYTREEYGLEAR